MSGPRLRFDHVTAVVGDLPGATAALAGLLGSEPIAELALPGVDLPERVGHVDHVDVGGRNARRGQRTVDDLGRQRREVLALAGQVAGEVGLVAARDGHRGCHRCLLSSVLQLAEYAPQGALDKRFDDLSLCQL